MTRLLKSSGFTLIEILIALGILAGSVGVFLTRAERSTQMIINDQKTFTATTLAANKMTELEREINDDAEGGNFVDEKEESGQFEEPFEDYEWLCSIKKVEIPVPQGGGEENSTIAMTVIKNIMDEISKSVREVKLTVLWGDETAREEGDSGREHEYTLTTHVVKL